jgi:hypothetical protein
MQALRFLMQADANYVDELAVSIYYWLFGSVLLRGTEVKTPTKCRVVGDFCPKVVVEAGRSLGHSQYSPLHWLL